VSDWDWIPTDEEVAEVLEWCDFRAAMGRGSTFDRILGHLKTTGWNWRRTLSIKGRPAMEGRR
jgi:hypothetical protein